MKLYFKKLFLLLLLTAMLLCMAAVFDFTVVGNQYSHFYTASLIDKVDRLCSITEPKIILVGNSNVSFGMDSALLEDAMGMPVVNLGLQGGLGNAFHEEIAKLNIQPGDIVVVSHIDYADDDKLNDPELAWITVEKNPRLLQILRPKDWLPMLRAYPNYAFNCFVRWQRGWNTIPAGTLYIREGVNTYGDFVMRTGQETSTYQFRAGELTVPQVGDACIARMNKLNKYICDKGARMVVSYSPIADGEFTPDREAYHAFAAELESRLDCPVISDIDDYFFPYNCFFDTKYHLNEVGARLRTEQLIRDLQKWQNP